MTDLSILRRESFERFTGKNLEAGYNKVCVNYTQEEMPFLSKVAKISVCYEVIVPIDNSNHILLNEKATLKSIDGRGSKSNMEDIILFIKNNIIDLVEEYPEQSIDFTTPESRELFIGKQLFVGIDEEFRSLYAVFEEKHFDKITEEEVWENIPVSNDKELFIGTYNERYSTNQKWFVFKERTYLKHDFKTVHTIEMRNKGVFKNNVTHILFVGQDTYCSVGNVIIDPKEREEFQFQKDYKHKWNEGPFDEGKLIVLNKSLYSMIEDYKYLPKEDNLILISGEKNIYYRKINHNDCQVFDTPVEQLFETNMEPYTCNDIDTIGNTYYIANMRNKEYVLKEVSYYSLTKQASRNRSIGEVVSFNGILYLVLGELENMRFAMKRYECLRFASKYEEYEISFKNFEDFMAFYNRKVNVRRVQLFEKMGVKWYFKDFTNRFSQLKTPVKIGDTVRLKEEINPTSEITSLEGKVKDISKNQEVITVCYFNYFEVKTAITNAIKL